MDFRKVFNEIPEEFDKWRPRYRGELFTDIIGYADVCPGKTVLEIGPGTGQATEPFLRTGCSYLAIELGEVFTERMKSNFEHYNNFSIINADFETHDFCGEKFDLVFSAATIQWIPEKIGFPKVFSLLKSGGTFAMFMTRTDYKTPNAALYDKIQEVYAEYFFPEIPYTCKLVYENVVNYGFTNYSYREYKSTRELYSEDYTSLISTHADHIMLREPYKTNFYGGIKAAIREAGDKITLNDTIALYLVKKP